MRLAHARGLRLPAQLRRCCSDRRPAPTPRLHQLPEGHKPADLL